MTTAEAIAQIRDAFAYYSPARGREALTVLDSLEAEIERLRVVVQDMEGSLLAYWTDIPQSVIEEWLPKARTALGGKP